MIRKVLAGAAISAAMLGAAQADALNFNLISTSPGTDSGTAARKVFDIAANYWSSVLTSTATVNIDIGFESFGPSGATILGSTQSSSTVMSVDTYQSQLQATKSSSQVDTLAAAHLPKIDAGGGIGMIKPGYTNPATKSGIDTTTRIYDHDDSTDNKVMYTTSANAKAIGLSNSFIGANTVFANGQSGVDASIAFNSDFNFDFDASNGTSAGKINFLVVAIHEIGHALGFVSGVDSYDYYGSPGGVDPVTYQTVISPNDDWFGSALDMFRYSSNPEGLNGGGAQLDWSIRDPNSDPLYSPDTNPYFSIDGGATSLFDNYLSRGEFNGASYQASHWRVDGANNGDGVPTQPYLGIMDPVGNADNYVSALDIAAFDAIGWNTSFDALGNPTYARSTQSIFLDFGGAVPEPATWGMMLVGFGALGAAARRRSRAITA
jgi:hypothetical protein